MADRDETANSQVGGTGGLPDCVELGIWTPIPAKLPASFDLKLKEVDAPAAAAVKQQGVMTFHAVGCTGGHADQRATIHVAAAMAAQVDAPQRFGGTPAAVRAAFLYHLGDVVYKHDKDTAGQPADLQHEHYDFAELYDKQFYSPFAAYAPPIFAVAGNHDGKNRDPQGPPRKSAIHHFLKNFCGLDDGDASDNHSTKRPPMRQPYPYWHLATPLADFIGLYTNVNNAGCLDDPMSDDRPQLDWLIRTLRDVKRAAEGRALFLMVHYPPYSAATNYLERGNPNLGPTPRPADKLLRPLGMVLNKAYRESGQYPDAVFSAHAHLYQRLTYTCGDGRQIPYLVAGGGGHAPIEKLGHPCRKGAPETAAISALPMRIEPRWWSLPLADHVELAAFNEQDFGFLRLTLDGARHRLTGEYFAAFNPAPGWQAPSEPIDRFTLDLLTHKVQ